MLEPYGFFIFLLKPEQSLKMNKNTKLEWDYSQKKVKSLERNGTWLYEILTTSYFSNLSLKKIKRKDFGILDSSECRNFSDKITLVTQKNMPGLMGIYGTCTLTDNRNRNMKNLITNAFSYVFELTSHIICYVPTVTEHIPSPLEIFTWLSVWFIIIY